MELPAWLKDPKPITSFIAAITALIIAITGLVKACDKRLEQASYETLAHAITDLQHQQETGDVACQPAASASLYVMDTPDASTPDANTPAVITLKPWHPPLATPKVAVAVADAAVVDAAKAVDAATPDASIAEAAAPVVDASIAEASAPAIDASVQNAAAIAIVPPTALPLPAPFPKAVDMAAERTQFARPAPKSPPSWEELRRVKDL